MAYFVSNPTIGVSDLNIVYTSGLLGYPWVSSTVNPLPSVPIEEMFGQIVSAQNSITPNTGGGGGEFIFLRVPTSTTVTAGLFYSWGDASHPYDVTLLPTSASTTTTSGAPVAVAINAVTSSSTNIQGTWFQVQGIATVLKDAVKLAPGVPIYFSKSAGGRVRVIGSAFYAILGARSATASTITTTTSSGLVYLNRPNLAASI